MRFLRLKSFQLLFIIILFFVHLSSCSTGGGIDQSSDDDNPFSPPAPPIEIPSTFSLPTIAIELNVDAISEESSTLSAISLAVGSGGEFSEVVSQGADAIIEANFFINTYLRFLSLIEIPVSPDQNNFELEIDEGILKIDFADFDFDGDGSPEGCTGSTCPVIGAVGTCPEEANLDALGKVCYRVWVTQKGGGELERFTSGVIDLFPTEDADGNQNNPGNGQFRWARLVPFTDFAVDETFYIGANYIHRDLSNPFNKSSDVFFVHNTEGLTGSLDNVSRNLIEKIGLDGVEDDPNKIQTTVKTFSEFEQITEGETVFTGLLNYIGRYRDDASFWSGTVDDIETKLSMTSETHIFNQYVNLEDGNGVNPEICDDLFISVADEDHLEPPSLSDQTGGFLIDFPEQPTF